MSGQQHYLSPDDTAPASTSFSDQNISGHARVHIGHHYQNNSTYGRAPSPGIFGYFDRRKRNKASIDAASKGYTQRLNVQLQAGADVDYRDENGWTALHYAAKSGHDDCVRSLLEAGSDVNTRSRRDAYPLLLAAENGHLDVVRTLLEVRGVALSGLPGSRPPMMGAVWSGDLEVVRILQQAGAAMHWGSTFHSEDDMLRINGVLGTAVCHHRTEILEWCLQNTTSGGHEGMFDQYIVYAAKHTWMEGIQLLLTYGNANNLFESPKCLDAALTEASKQGHAGIVGQLINSGAYPDAVDDSAFTALWWATNHNRTQAAMVLLERGSNPDRLSANHETPLHRAVWKGNFAMVQMLVQGGADLAIVQVDGTRPGLTAVALAIDLQDKQPAGARDYETIAAYLKHEERLRRATS